MSKLLLLVAVGVLMAQSLTVQQDLQKRDNPDLVAHSRAVADRFRMFAYAADQYMKSVGSTAARAGGQSIYWPQIASSGVAPPAMVSVSMPSDWRIWVDADGSWTLCAGMDALAAASLAQLSPSHVAAVSPGGAVVDSVSIGTMPTSPSSEGSLVFGATATDAAARAAKCAS